MTMRLQIRPYQYPVSTRSVGSDDPLIPTIAVGDRVTLYLLNDEEVSVRATWRNGSKMGGIVAMPPRPVNGEGPFSLDSDVVFDEVHVFRLQKPA